MTKKYSLFTFLLFVLLLAGCTGQADNISNNKKDVNSNDISSKGIWAEFTGEKGEAAVASEGLIRLDKDIFDDDLAHYYNIEINGKTVYFFVVKDKDGIYRAAANACQVCSDAKMGFRQEGNFMVCNTCGNRYPLEKIATEKGGCNPAPINSNLEVIGDEVVVELGDIEQVSSFF